jgi:dTDP-4-amino-4,6-dideoxygalactose transaminase
MPAVPFLDLRRELEPDQPALLAAAERVIASGRYIGGPEVDELEQAFARACGRAHVVGCANGLDALRLALQALGVGPGDEVIVPDLTFIASALAPLQIGATPVLVDVRADSLLLDVDAVVQAVGPRTRAVIAVHLYGQQIDVAELRARLPATVAIVEDAAQAHGAVDHAGHPPGTHGAIATYSFYPTKNLGALGDAGALATDDLDLAQRVRRLANYGAASKYAHVEPGWNSRLDPLQAALLQVRLARLPAELAARRRAAARYHAAFASTPAVQTLPASALATSAWHLYPIRVAARDELAQRLRGWGIETALHYPSPCSHAPALAGQAKLPRPTPVAARACRELLSLPLFPSITTEELDAVAHAVHWALAAGGHIRPRAPSPAHEAAA